jgi:glycosyltransferase involved in cell wall biosynthesis
MRIAIDAHSVGTQLAGNVTYITNLIEAFAEIDRENEYTIYVSRPDAYDRYADRWPNFIVRRIRDRNRVMRLLFSFHSKLRLHRTDILFVQFNAPPFAPCKVVTAIHDLAFEHVPETFKFISRAQMKLTIRRTARESAHIVACSEYSRQDIIRTYHIAPEKVTTVHLAAPPHFAPVADQGVLNNVRRKYDLQGEFILGVGSIQPRKNLVRLVEAYSSLIDKGIDIPPLVLVGKKAWLFEDSVRAAAAHGVADRVHFTGFVPEEDLPALYTLATCFVYPSFFEGFGIPPLEAMQCGTPVITGDRTSLPEVVGDAGIMVDPYDISAIAGAIERLVKDKSLRDELRQKGFDRAKMFSWQRAARKILDVFERVNLDG